MGSLCVPLSYLSGGSAVQCGACLRHHVCGCPPSEAIGCERDAGFCLKGVRQGRGGGGISNQSSFSIAYIWDTTVTLLVTQISISQTWDFLCAGLILCFYLLYNNIYLSLQMPPMASKSKNTTIPSICCLSCLSEILRSSCNK